MDDQPTFLPRRTEPDTEFDWIGVDGERRSAKADSDGVLWVKNAEEQVIADGMSLPVARKAAADAKAASTTRPATSTPPAAPERAPAATPSPAPAEPAS